MPSTITKDLFEVMAESLFKNSTPIFDKDMGARLSGIRKKLKLTQAKLAERLGLNQADICRLEKGKNINAPPSCLIFKRALGEHFETFLTGKGYFNYGTEKIRHNKQIRGKVISLS